MARNANVRLAVARVERQHALIEELRCAAPKRVSARELSARTGVSTRTVERDIAGLRAAGVPVAVRSGPHGGYELETRAALEPVSLSSAEAAAIVVSLAAVGPRVSASAQSAMAKLLAALTPVTR